jgi:hypothetical protein
VDDKLRVDIILAASRGVYVALTEPTKHLGEAARAFGYAARTAKGDAFETAFEWARENAQRAPRTDDRASFLCESCRNGIDHGDMYCTSCGEAT